MKRKKVSSQDPDSKVLALFLKALSELYRLDRCSPGIVAAWLPDKEQYYVSIARYETARGEGKQIIASAYGKTPDEAIDELARKWYEGTANARSSAFW